jgi:hypothetical protein
VISIRAQRDLSFAGRRVHLLYDIEVVSLQNNGKLDKEATSYDYLFDAFRLALKFYSFRDTW